MKGVRRNAEIVDKRSLRPAVRDLVNPCPICKARPGWRCTKKVGDQFLPRKTTHPERKRG
jgi:hypothetical protein